MEIGKFVKEKIRRLLKYITGSKVVLWTTLVLVIVFLTFIFRESIYNSFIGEFLIFIRNNISHVVTLVILIVSTCVFIYHWKFVGTKTWLWRKVAFIALFVSALFCLLNKNSFNLTYSQEFSIRNEERIKFESILDSIKREDNQSSKRLKRELSSWKDRFDSLSVIANSKDQKIHSLEGVNKNLRAENHFLDSLNSLPKRPLVIKEEAGGSVSENKKTQKKVLRKRPVHKNIEWVKVKYIPIKVCRH